MLNHVDGQEQLIVMLVGLAAIFRAAICQDTQHWQVALLIKRLHLIIEHISCCNRCFGRVELGVGHLGIGIDIGWTCFDKVESVLVYFVIISYFIGLV